MEQSEEDERMFMGVRGESEREVMGLGWARRVEVGISAVSEVLVKDAQQ